jgi:hypothetical protein
MVPSIGGLLWSSDAFLSSKFFEDNQDMRDLREGVVITSVAVMDQR